MVNRKQPGTGISGVFKNQTVTNAHLTPPPSPHNNLKNYAIKLEHWHVNIVQSNKTNVTK